MMNNANLYATHRAAFAVFVLITVSFVIFTWWAHDTLPEKISVHFDLEGNVNRTAEKAEFLYVNLGLAALMFLSFGTIGWILKKVPDRFVNLPNKNYWLEPERRHQSTERFQTWYLWMGTLTVSFLFYVAWQVFRTSMGYSEKLQFGMLELSLYLIAMTAFCILLYRSFSKAAADQG